MSIKISSDFDAGNIIVDAINGGQCDLRIRHDQDSEFFQWFYFRVDGAKGLPLNLRITNAGQAAYPLGWQDYQACVSTDNADWTRTPTSFTDGILRIDHTPDADSVWLAYFAPYSSERHAALVERTAAKPGVTHKVLGQTLDGRAMDLLTMGEGPLQVWLYARQHPGETMAEWWMEGALEYLTSDTDEAKKLREAASFNIVPNMNPDGSARGHLRTNAVGVNLNREWAAPSLPRSPEVFYVMQVMQQTGIDFAMDVHGDEAIPHVFMAGFDGIPSLSPKTQALYKAYLARLLQTTPDFQTEAGYPPNPPGKANMGISTNQVAERFGAVAMTLEMPFKDHNNAPDPRKGWSPERSIGLGRDCMIALAGFVDELKPR